MNNQSDQLVTGECRRSAVCHLRTNVTVDINDLQINVEYVKNKKKLAGEGWLFYYIQ